MQKNITLSLIFFIIYNIIIITTDNIFLHASLNYNKLFSQPPPKHQKRWNDANAYLGLHNNSCFLLK